MLKLYCARTHGAEEHRVRYPGRTPRPGSGLAMSLLAYAVEDTWGIPLPEVGETETGTPVFPGHTDKHFSLSHTRGYVLAAVSDSPVGADIQSHRPLSAALERNLRLGADTWEPMEVWSIREAVLKYHGRGDLRKPLELHRDGERVRIGDSGLICSLVRDIPDCACAVCTGDSEAAPELRWVKVSQLYT